MKRFIVFYPIVSGVLLGSSYNYPKVWFLGFFSLLPLIHFLYNTDKLKKIFLGSFVFGFVFMSLVTHWFFSAYPLDWAGVSDGLSGISFILLHWIFMNLILGLSFGFLGISFFILKKKNFSDIFLFTCLWVIFEYLKTWIFSLSSYDSQILLGPHFTTGSLGYILAFNDNLLQLARFGGIYLLSFFIVLAGSLFYWILFSCKRKNRLLYLSIFILFILSISFFNLEVRNNDNSKKVDVAVVHTEFPSFFRISEEVANEKNEVYRRLLNNLENKEMLDILVFPEDTRFTSELINNDQDENFYKDIFRDNNVLIVDSGRISNILDNIRSRIFYYSTQKGLLGEYDKMILVPDGEYLPLFSKFFLNIFQQNEFLNDFNKSRLYSRGDNTVVIDFNGYKVGGLFCNEIYSPILFRKLALAGANLFINPSSHAIFKGNKVLYRQVLNVSKVRAVENGRYLIQAGNFIPSSIITNKGEVVSSEDPVISGQVKLLNYKTFYVRFGDWILILSLLVIGIFLFRCYPQGE